jgi:hypothetical protein
MSSILTTGSKTPWLAMWLCLAILAVCLCLRGASRATLDDDNLYLAYAAQSQLARAKPLEQSLIDRVQVAPDCQEAAFRLAFRKRYASNYAGYSAVQGAIQAAAPSIVPAGSKSIILGTLVAKALFLLSGSIALAVAARRGGNREIEAAAICSFIALAALEFAPKWMHVPARVSIATLPRTILQELSSFFVIARAHSYFEVTPRNSALFLFAIALVFKWQGRLTAAVITLLMMAPMHQTYAGLGLVLFAIASAVSRPDVFATPLRRAMLIGAGLVYVGREHFVERLAVSVQVVSAVVLVLSALVFFRGVCSESIAAFRLRVLGNWASREIALDALSLGALVMLVTLVCWVADAILQDPITRRYVWANFPMRTLSFVRFPVFIAGFWLLLTRTQWLSSVRGQIRFAAGCVLASVLLIGVSARSVDTGVWGRLKHQFARNLRPPKSGPFRPESEEHRIYAFLTMVAAGELEPAEADAKIVGDRAIICKPKH